LRGGILVSLEFNEVVREKLESMYIHLDRDFKKGKREIKTLNLSEEILIEPHTGFYAGDSLCSMGAFSYSNSPLPLGMKIGRYCALSWGIKVTGPRHPYEWVTISNITYDKFAANVRSFAEKNGYTKNYDPRVLEKPMPVIGHDVWIGQNVTINRGVSIGNGAVVAAFSVVTKNIPPFEIWGGNPARKIKNRFEGQTRDLIMEVEWWNYDFGQFQDLDLRNVEEFMNEIKENSTRYKPYTPPMISGKELINILTNLTK
jgi:acetyltransferase-like isoleucine patch superfamily enzyme